MSLRDVKLTIEDYQGFPDDGKRHEIIDGEHYVTPAPNLRHQAISRNLTILIGSFLRDHPHGRLFAAPCDVYLSRFDVVEPDLLFVSSAKNALFAPNGHPGRS
jgi:Uma2 family endonuclease